mmetsp:Transcript_9066/g.27818  ORF Transcript_9066/g.27818 Transcript_9066/m.27818 type:complete len:296 (+) Transcript_9066:1514-2401(+)
MNASLVSISHASNTLDSSRCSRLATTVPSAAAARTASRHVRHASTFFLAAAARTAVRSCRTRTARSNAYTCVAANRHSQNATATFRDATADSERSARSRAVFSAQRPSHTRHASANRRFPRSRAAARAKVTARRRTSVSERHRRRPCHRRTRLHLVKKTFSTTRHRTVVARQLSKAPAALECAARRSTACSTMRSFLASADLPRRRHAPRFETKSFVRTILDRTRRARTVVFHLANALARSFRASFATSLVARPSFSLSKPPRRNVEKAQRSRLLCDRANVTASRRVDNASARQL